GTTSQIRRVDRPLRERRSANCAALSDPRLPWQLVTVPAGEEGSGSRRAGRRGGGSRSRPWVGARGPDGRGANRGRDLDRLRYPGFPGTAGLVDQEPGGGAAVDLPGVHGRPRGPAP